MNQLTEDFAKGIPGQRLVLSGKVLNVATCKPVQASAHFDFVEDLTSARG
jgi:hypothetical protein